MDNKTAHVPELSTPPTNNPKCPIHQPNPPRCRGRMKSQPRRISRAKMRRLTYRVIQPCQGQSGRIWRVGYVKYKVQMLGEHPRSILDQRDITEVEDSRSCIPRTAQHCTQAATYHIPAMVVVGFFIPPPQKSIWRGFAHSCPQSLYLFVHGFGPVYYSALVQLGSFISVSVCV